MKRACCGGFAAGSFDAVYFLFLHAVCGNDSRGKQAARGVPHRRSAVFGQKGGMALRTIRLPFSLFSKAPLIASRQRAAWGRGRYDSPADHGRASKVSPS